MIRAVKSRCALCVAISAVLLFLARNIYLTEVDSMLTVVEIVSEDTGLNNVTTHDMIWIADKGQFYSKGNFITTVKCIILATLIVFDNEI